MEYAYCVEISSKNVNPFTKIFIIIANGDYELIAVKWRRMINRKNSECDSYLEWINNNNHNSLDQLTIRRRQSWPINWCSSISKRNNDSMAYVSVIRPLATEQKKKYVEFWNLLVFCVVELCEYCHTERSQRMNDPLLINHSMKK